MTTELEILKDQSATFWDLNPCGGRWSSYREFLKWYRETEPEMFQILDSYNWSGLLGLDVGCGQGPSLNYLASKGAHVVGVDMSMKSLHRAHAGAIELGHADSTDFILADAENLPFRSDGCDFSISLGVLHHTPDPQEGINEIHRVLRKDGTCIIMLYRSGNPKWWMTSILRKTSLLINQACGTRGDSVEKLRREIGESDESGTALLELFGVPIMRAYSNREALEMFYRFSDVCIENHTPGFRRLVDILPFLRRIEALLRWLDQRTQNMWGFYQVVFSRKL